MATYIKGNYRKSLLQGDNGYIVGLFKIKEADDDNQELVGETVPFTGYFHELNNIDTYIFYGKLVNHDKYGEQLNIKTVEDFLLYQMSVFDFRPKKSRSFYIFCKHALPHSG